MIVVDTVTPSKAGKQCKITLSDGERLYLSSDTVALYTVTPGDSFSDDKWQEILAESAYRLAMERAFNLLEFRARTSQELYDKLLEKTDEDTALRVTEKMRELGLLDDLALLREKVENLLFVKRYGMTRVVQDLARKGYDKEDIQTLAEELGYDPVDTLVTLITRLYADDLENDEDGKALRRTVSALMRRGFTYSEIKDALASLE